MLQKGKTGNDPVLSWKVLRALSRESFETFSAVTKAGKNLEVAVRRLFPQVCVRQ